MAFTRIRKRPTKKYENGFSYQAVVREEIDGIDKVIWSGSYEKKGQAVAAAAEYLDGVNKGTVKHIVEKQTFESFYLNVWLPKTRISVEREETIRMYEQYFNNHWVEHFGSLKMTQIEPIVLNRWLEIKKKQGLSLGYLARIQSLLSGVFEFAVETNAMGTNPMKKKATVRVPVPKNSTRDAYTLDEVRDILAFIKNNDSLRKDYYFYYLAMTTGLRRGELCAIKLDDIQYLKDGLTALIRINKTVIKVRDGGATVEVDGSSAKKNHERLIPLDPQSTIELKRHLERTHTGVAFGRKWNQNIEDGQTWFNDGWLFHRGNGRLTEPDNYTKNFKKYCELGEFRYMGLHATRHTVATGLHRAGVPVGTAATLLGQTPETFLKTYVHVSEEDLIQGQGSWAKVIKED